MSFRRSPDRRAPQLTDEALMSLIQDDDPAAFGAFYDRHCDTALGLARFICADAAQAESVMADGFRAVWRLRSGYDPARGSPRSWLLGLIRRYGLETSDGRSRPTLDEPPRGPLTELAPLQREVITLAYFGGLSHVEIGDRLRLPTSSVKARMRQGLRTLSGQDALGTTPADPRAPRRAIH